MYCLDYGTSEILPIQNIYPGLDTWWRWTDVVEQAKPCRLAGVKPVSIRILLVSMRHGTVPRCRFLLGLIYTKRRR